MSKKKPDLKQKNILILSGVRGDTRRYRSFHPYQQLRLAGLPSTLSHITDSQLPGKIANASVVIFHRTAYDPLVERLLQTIHEHGGVAILDIDDFIFDPAAFQWIASPDFQDPVRAALYQEDLRRHRTTLEHCQAVTASTHYLADHVQSMGKPVWIHRNAFSLEMLAISENAYRQRPQSSRRLVIGYASGTPTHDRDFEVAKPALQRVMQRYPEVELRLIGPLDPGQGWGDLSPRIQRQPLVPWRELPHHLAQFDINLAPLVRDNPFGQSKSEIKFVEAALVRSPTVASPTKAFAHAIRSGKNGYLAAEEADWVESLEKLINEPDLRRSIGQQAYQDVLDRYHPAVRAGHLVETLNQINQHVKGQPLWEAARVAMESAQQRAQSPQAKALWLDPQLEQRPSLVQMGIYTLRQRGPLTLLRQVWVFIRRMLVPIFPYTRAG